NLSSARLIRNRQRDQIRKGHQKKRRELLAESLPEGLGVFEIPPQRGSPHPADVGAREIGTDEPAGRAQAIRTVLAGINDFADPGANEVSIVEVAENILQPPQTPDEGLDPLFGKKRAEKFRSVTQLLQLLAQFVALFRIESVEVACASARAF